MDILEKEIWPFFGTGTRYNHTVHTDHKNKHSANIHFAAPFPNIRPGCNIIRDEEVALLPAEGLSWPTKRRNWCSSTLAWAPVFCKHHWTSALHRTPLKSIYSLPGQISVPKEFRVPSQCHSSSSMDYSHPAQWLLGASEPRLCSQMGA